MQLITDNQTNTIYFSEWLKRDFNKLYNELHAVLEKYDVPNEVLKYTKDYWCRDYMPIQISENVFIQYKYYPDYLLKQESDQYYITNPSETCENLGIETQKINIVIDGGNIVKCDDTIIMTEKVFYENPHHQKNELISLLESTFQANILFLPWDKKEIYGHADGLVRYLSGGKVLFTNYKDFDSELADNMRNRLSKKFDVVELEYTSKKVHPNSWAYINFLQTKQVIILPYFEIEEDEQAMLQFKNLFPEYENRIVSIDASSIVKKGGVFNCISWNIKNICD